MPEQVARKAATWGKEVQVQGIWSTWACPGFSAQKPCLLVYLQCLQHARLSSRSLSCCSRSTHKPRSHFLQFIAQCILSKAWGVWWGTACLQGIREARGGACEGAFLGAHREADGQAWGPTLEEHSGAFLLYRPSVGGRECTQPKTSLQHEAKRPHGNRKYLGCLHPRVDGQTSATLWELALGQRRGAQQGAVARLGTGPGL